MSAEQSFSIRAGELMVDIAPAIGGSLAAFYSNRDGARFDWLRPASRQALEESDPEGMASFPLIPFCNRVRNGRMRFDGRDIAMPPNRGSSPHTIHGTAWKAAWSVTHRDAHSATLRLVSHDGIWPYRFAATQHIVLDPSSLSITIEVENRDSRPMPLGVGHHPYLLHRPGTRLQAAVEQMWLSDDEVMPTGLGQPELIEQLRNGVQLSDLVLDNNFVGWDRIARVEWPSMDRQGIHALTLCSESPLDYFVLYSPSDKDHFCIEPVSNCTDWLNLQDRYTPEQTGGASLGRGETYTAGFSLHTECPR